MTIATTDLTNWLGTTLAATLSVNQIASALADGNRYCNGKMQELGISGGGDAYDAAVFYASRASILRQLDAMGIKPQSLHLSDLNVGSDVSQNFDQLMRLADERLQSAAIFSAGNKTNLYIVRLRGGQGLR
jgi:hypothetical protein